MTTDRSLLMRVLLLPHGSTDSELDQLCGDIREHTMKTLPDGSPYITPVDTDWIFHASTVALLRADETEIMRRAWNSSFPIKFQPTPDGVHGDAVTALFLDMDGLTVHRLPLRPMIPISPGMTAQVLDGGST